METSYEKAKRELDIKQEDEEKKLHAEIKKLENELFTKHKKERMRLAMANLDALKVGDIIYLSALKEHNWFCHSSWKVKKIENGIVTCELKEMYSSISPLYDIIDLKIENKKLLPLKKITSLEFSFFFVDYLSL